MAKCGCPTKWFKFLFHYRQVCSQNLFTESAVKVKPPLLANWKLFHNFVVIITARDSKTFKQQQKQFLSFYTLNRKFLLNKKLFIQQTV